MKNNFRPLSILLLAVLLLPAFASAQSNSTGGLHFEINKVYPYTSILLLDAIRKMPCWKPAQYADGTQVKQDFVLTVGNMENCNVSLLSIRRR